jgi:four helix bundle protein
MQDFRRLLVWSRSHALATTIRRTVHGFRGAGYAELKSQLVSAAESIPSNVVEGCGAATSKEFARFLDISIKSTSEVEYRLELAKEYGLLPTPEWRRLSAETVEIRKMLYGLRRAVLSADDPNPRRRPRPRKAREQSPDVDAENVDAEN